MLIVRGAVLYSVLTLAASAVFAQVASQPTPSGGKQQGKQPSAASQPDSGRAPIASSPSQAVTLTVQNVAGEPRKTEEAKEPAHNGWLGPEGAIAALTAILAFVTWRLVVHTRELVGEATKTSERQAKETVNAIAVSQQSADAAVTSLRIMQDTAERQLRAYVNVFDSYADWTAGENLARVVSVKVRMRNSGQTPAHKVTSWASVFSKEADCIVFPDLPPTATVSSVGVSGPGNVDHFILRHQCPLGEDEVETWRHGKKTLFVYGRISYTDAFGVGRYTAFRHFIPPDGVFAERGHFAQCREGNEAT